MNTEKREFNDNGLYFLEGCQYKQIEGKYIVTSDGRVFTFWNNRRKWKLQNRRKHTNGYIRATINGKDVYIHRLVAMLFLENPNNYKEVNHKDGNKENNNVENLEWCTRSQNNKHAFITGLRSYEHLREMAKRPRKTRRKFTEDQIREIRASEKSDKTLAQEYGVVCSVIWQIKNRRTYKEI